MTENSKPSWRFIPKPLFQGLALLLLAGCVGLTVEIVLRQGWPFNALLTWLGDVWWWLAAFLTFLILFVGWVLIILPIRIFSQMPTYREELETAGADNFSDLYRQQREKMVLDKKDGLTPAQQAIRSRSLALGGLVLAFITGAATVIIFLISDLLWVSGLVIALVSMGLSLWHGIKSWRLSR